MKRKYRRQTQHFRRYRSGKHTLINRGIVYKIWAKSGRWGKSREVIELLDRTGWEFGRTSLTYLRNLSKGDIIYKLSKDFGFDEFDPRFRRAAKESLIDLYRDTFLEQLEGAKIR